MTINFEKSKRLTTRNHTKPCNITSINVRLYE